MKDIKTLLLYPPEQAWPGMMIKPNGSLAYPYLGAALRNIGVEVYVYDACVGNENDNLDDFFKKSKLLPSGMVQTGVTDQRILEMVVNYDVIGITSIFSQQETQVLRCARLIKTHFPEKKIFSGGVNAKSRPQQFFDAGVDMIFTSESEITIQEVIKIMQKENDDFSPIGKIIYKDKSGKILDNTHFGDIIMDLDKLPIPAWDLLPNERYWKIGRPHGGSNKIVGKELKYASMMTSRGCPFNCSFCHIADETEKSISGAIGKFRIKSDERVQKEFDILKNDIGVKQIYIEDDSLFGMKRRAIRLLKSLVDYGLDLLDVNGVNTIHLVKKSGKPGWMVPDEELIELLAEVGFTDLCLPFETANLRIMKKWCSNKLALDKFDPIALVKMLTKYKINVETNYMIGFPDETKEEIDITLNFARKMKEHGIDHVHFSLVMPVPGTPIFKYCRENNMFPAVYNSDKFQWTKANLVNTPVPPHELENIRDKAWEEFNNEEFKKSRKDWVNRN